MHLKDLFVSAAALTFLLCSPNSPQLSLGETDEE